MQRLLSLTLRGSVMTPQSRSHSSWRRFKSLVLLLLAVTSHCQVPTLVYSTFCDRVFIATLCIVGEAFQFSLFVIKAVLIVEFD